MQNRPLTVTLLSWLLIAAGAIGIAYHFTEFTAQHPFQLENVLILCVRLLAVISGAFMLRGQDWARWVALAWIAFHAVLSFFHSTHEAVMHSILLVLFAYLLFRPEVRAYFRHGVTRDV